MPYTATLFYGIYYHRSTNGEVDKEMPSLIAMIAASTVAYVVSHKFLYFTGIWIQSLLDLIIWVFVFYVTRNYLRDLKR